MPAATPSGPTRATVSGRSPATASTDAIVVGLCLGDDGPTLHPGAEAVDAAMDGMLLDLVGVLGATGKEGEVRTLASNGATTAPRIVAVGLGRREADVDAEALRRAAGTAARSLADHDSAVFAMSGESAAMVAPVAEGALLAAYSYDRYRSDGTNPPLSTITVYSAKARTSEATTAIERANVLAAAVNQARDWINTPPADLTPAQFADEAKTLASPHGLKATVLDERRLRRDGYGGILGVGAGSTHPPRLVRLEHRAASSNAPNLVLVGKGITFDSGGLSLKPGEAMTTMKYDMSGAAAVLAAIVAIAELKSDVNVVAYAALAENMPSGSATRPSDVLSMFGGRTVEVLNTDAEGRLVLADVLARSGQDQPDVVVDVATLTGAMTVALGHRVAGVMGNDDALIETVRDVAAQAGEPLWPLPIPEEMRAKLDSSVADLANIGDRFGGGLQAAAFLQEFVPDGVRWAHLDIAGPAWNRESPRGYTPKEATGTAVRTLVGLAETMAAGDLPARD